MMILVAVVFFIIALRLNSLWERHVKAKRILHGIMLPLYHYLGMLDHEIQGEVEEVNNLFRQAVLDHITELRAFFLQPASKDLALSGKVSWASNLNNLLLAMEETLEDDDEDVDAVELRGQVSHMLKFIQGNPYLSKLIKKPLGIVNYSAF